ncbi:MAG: C4-dicarboxylic acid transporter DauA [Myxococcales bacterium]|nr:C4-dicarboxylic acid transporter DauA [Myxococcales bacterium]
MAALRGVFSEGYHKADFRADLLAGAVVGIVALPLSMALAIATGVAPQHGLFTAVVAGGIIALLGGSRFQVSGPTAAFVVVLVPIVTQFGLGGLMLASAMAGVILVTMAVARLGRLLQFIPHPVTTGFTAGIAIVIATLQLKDFLGLSINEMPDHFVDRALAIFSALPSVQPVEVVIGALTLSTLLLWPRLTRSVPAPLVALTLGALVAYALGHILSDADIATIGTRFSYTVDGVVHAGIPQGPPMFMLPWNAPGADGQPIGFSWDLIRSLAPSASAIAMLGAIESLLSAVVADSVTGHRHDPDVELFAQGIGNIVVPFFGGFAATGAIARTATNIRSGARSPIAAIIHAAFVLAAMLLLAPLLAYLPMASLAALLLLVAWNMSEVRHVLHAVRVSPRSDVFVLLTCIVLTVVFDMVVAVVAGVLLAALLFMRRMAEVSNVRLTSDAHQKLAGLPPGVLHYAIGGPLFFGAAQKAMSALDSIGNDVWAVVIDLTDVPAMDATGLVNLESALARLRHGHRHVVIAGVQPQPRSLLSRAHIGAAGDSVTICDTLADAVANIRNRFQQRA